MTKGESHELVFCYADYAAVHLKRFHDLCLVWPIQIPDDIPLAAGADKLGDRFLRVLLPRAGEPYRTYGLFRSPAQDDAGSHHARRVRGIFRAVSRRAVEMESNPLLRLHRVGRLFRFREILARENSNRRATSGPVNRHLGGAL